MNVKWIILGARLIPLIISAVDSIEEITEKGTPSQDKQDAAIELFKNAVRGLEIGFGQELIDENAFDSVIRKLIDVYVELQNTVAKLK